MCQLHKTHASAEPLTLDVHHVWPLAMGGPDTAGNKVSICQTGHRNIHHLIHLMIRNLPLPKAHVHEKKLAQAGIAQWEAAGKPGKAE